MQLCIYCRNWPEAVQKNHPKDKSGICLRTHLAGKAPYPPEQINSLAGGHRVQILFSHWAQWGKIISKPWFEICVRAGPKPQQAQRLKEIAWLLSSHLKRSITEGVCSQLSSLLVAVASFVHLHPNPLLAPTRVGWGTGTGGSLLSWMYLNEGTTSISMAAEIREILLNTLVSQDFSLAAFHFFCMEAARAGEPSHCPHEPSLSCPMPLQHLHRYFAFNSLKFPHFCVFPLAGALPPQSYQGCCLHGGKLILYFRLSSQCLLPSWSSSRQPWAE